MSQKHYKCNIVLNLLKSPNHVRGLAKDLETNQTTTARKLKELKELNIVDYRQEGRNKVYFVKNTLEAQEFVFISEHYKLFSALKKYSILRKIIKKIKGNSKIKLAVLFGSYAKYSAHGGSDIDIYIETKNKEIKKELESINTKLSVKIGKYNEESHLIKEIEKNHVILKGVEVYYEKCGFFS